MGIAQRLTFGFRHGIRHYPNTLLVPRPIDSSCIDMFAVYVKDLVVVKHSWVEHWYLRRIHPSPILDHILKIQVAGMTVDCQIVKSRADSFLCFL